MFEFQRIDTVIRADEPGKGRDGARPHLLGKRHLRRDIDGRALHRNPDHPPVTGGNSAISRAPAIGASIATKSWSIAARNRPRSANAAA